MQPSDEEPTLKADPFAQRQLLDLQEVDSTIDRLEHRLKTLPEVAALADLAERRTDVSARHGKAQTAVGDLAREQRKADADVEQVKARRARNAERIRAGLVGDPKQLQAMQHETETLARRITDLEDAELEVMERLEQTQHELESLARELAEIDARAADQQSSRERSVADLGEKRADAETERKRLAEQIPADLLALYDRLRAQLGGVAVGALHQRRCGGCRLDVGAAELARIAVAPGDEVVRCEECSRILVRTAESGI